MLIYSCFIAEAPKMDENAVVPEKIHKLCENSANIAILSEPHKCFKDEIIEEVYFSILFFSA